MPVTFQWYMHFHKYLYYPITFEAWIDQQEVALKNSTLTDEIFIHISEQLVSVRIKNYNEKYYPIN